MNAAARLTPEYLRLLVALILGHGTKPPTGTPEEPGAQRGGWRRDGVFERPKGSGKWWIRWTCTLGHEHREPVGPRGLARERHSARRAAVRDARSANPPREYCPRLVRRNRPLLFDEIAADYMTHSERNKRSHADDRPKIARFLKLFEGRLASDITSREIEDLKAARKAEGVAFATVNHDLKLLKAIFNRAVKAGRLQYNPVRAVKLFKENNARNRCLSAEEETRLLNALPERMRPFVIVALHTGMRRGELKNLRWEDVDFYTGTLRIREAKSGEGRSLAINSVVRATLQALRRQRVQEARAAGDGREILSPFVFCSLKGHFMWNFEREWRPALQRAGIPAFRFHDFRHNAESRIMPSWSSVSKFPLPERPARHLIYSA